MIQAVYSPQWFYGKDLMIDAVSGLVLLLIAITSFRFYRINRSNKNHLLMAISFLFLAVSFAFKILTHFTLYYTTNGIKDLGFVKITYQIIKPTDTLFAIGFLAYRLLTLLGLYALYSVYQKNQSSSNICMIIFLLITSTYFSKDAYYMFHLTSMILLALVTYHYFTNYSKNKNLSTKLLAYSFALITVSQVMFMLTHYGLILGVTGEVVQLIGYTILLITFVMVIKHGKKKR